jgi:hypothetical protein
MRRSIRSGGMFEVSICNLKLAVGGLVRATGPLRWSELPDRSGSGFKVTGG